MNRAAHIKLMKRIARRTLRTIKDGNNFARFEVFGEGEIVECDSLLEASILEAMFACDDATLIIWDIARGVSVGHIYFNWCNDYSECISDYTSPIAPTMRHIETYIETL